MTNTTLYNYYFCITKNGNRVYKVSSVNSRIKHALVEIIFTGTRKECMLLLDPQGLEGSFEDKKNKVAFRK